MTAKKAAAKRPAKKVDPEATATEAAGETEKFPEFVMEGEAYSNGYHGVSQDDEDYSVAAQVSKLNEA